MKKLGSRPPDVPHPFGIRVTTVRDDVNGTARPEKRSEVRKLNREASACDTFGDVCFSCRKRNCRFRSRVLRNEINGHDIRCRSILTVYCVYLLVNVNSIIVKKKLIMTESVYTCIKTHLYCISQWLIAAVSYVL